ncbi:MAG: flagellar basal body P-ring protein FlgI [Epsilonproteobacteria bacterium]|nr:flagellar basal body P-ring protein FlgI [Campylobacterota bacterium]
MQEVIKLDVLEKRLTFLFIITFYFIATVNLFAQRLADVSSIIGVRDNQLIGYGLVVGLNGTGDSSSAFTNQTLANLLKNVNVKLDPKDIKSKNVAAVVVTAKLPPFARQGDKLDITISSIGDAKSIEGGTLLLTPLKGVDGRIYALAQGHITIGGFNTGRSKGGQLHFTTVGKLYGGATVEREIIYDIYHKKTAVLSLKKSNFNNAVTIQNLINKTFKNKHIAIALDPRSIELHKPANMSMPEFLAKVQDIQYYTPSENVVVVDERTGTIVAGSNIAIDPIVITQGTMMIKITKRSSMAELADIFQKYKARPKDIIAILETLKSSGALKAKLKLN